MFKITSSNNQFVKDINKLKKRRNRWKEKKYIIEGFKIVEEAIDENVKFDYIIFSEDILNTSQYYNIIDKINENITVIEVSNEIFLELSDTETPQGILAVLGFENNIYESLELNDEKATYIYLDGIQDPGNLGTIIRSADAFNINGIILGDGCVDPYNLKVVRSTMGSIFRVPIYPCNEEICNLTLLKENGFNVVSLDLRGSDLKEEPLKSDKNIFIIGNESNGVSDCLLEASNVRIKIPMPGKAESLNAGVAASIIMYEAMKI